MKTLDHLIGTTVKKISNVHDYIQIIFSSNIVLTIYNNYQHDCDNLLDFIGEKVKKINESDKSFTIFFENNQLVIGLDDHDYNGPEAMTMHQGDKIPIIWD